MVHFLHKNKNNAISKRYKKAIKYKTLVTAPPTHHPQRHEEENKHRERKKGKDNLSNSEERERERQKEDKEAERRAWAKRNELRDKNISHYLLPSIFLILRLSIHLRPSVSIEMCPRHQQAAQLFAPTARFP
jgi:hypothetical protein